MQFDNKNKWYEQLIPDVRVQSFLVGREGDASQLLAQPTMHQSPLVRMEQVHGAQVQVVQDAPSASETLLPKTDAVLTSVRGVILEVRVADCLPVVIFHPRGLVGLVHAGRQGTKLHILEKTVRRAQEVFGALDGLVIWFGPAICVEHYQVDRERDLHFDLVKENRTQLKSVLANVSHTLIESGMCTVKDNAAFYSYRANATSLRNRVFVSLT